MRENEFKFLLKKCTFYILKIKLILINRSQK